MSMLDGYTEEEIAALTPDELAALQGDDDDGEQDDGADSAIDALLADDDDDTGEEQGAQNDQAADGADHDEAAAEADADAANQGEDDDEPAAEVPAAPGFDERREALFAKKEELAEKLENGDIDVKEYTKQSAQIDSELVDVSVQKGLFDERMRQMTRDWEKAQKAFFQEDDIKARYVNKPIALRALDEVVRSINGDPKFSEVSFADRLAEADRRVCAEFGIKPAEKAPANQREVAPSKPEKRVPKTLADVPAAAPAGTGEFSRLDGLAGEALEDAISRLTPEQQQRYLASA